MNIKQKIQKVKQSTCMVKTGQNKKNAKKEKYLIER